MKYQIVICYNKEKALKIFDQKKYIFQLVCSACNKEFYFATDRHYRTVIHLVCPHCHINQFLFLEDLQNNHIYKWELN